jgi:hypothetical protein
MEALADEVAEVERPHPINRATRPNSVTALMFMADDFIEDKTRQLYVDPVLSKGSQKKLDRVINKKRHRADESVVDRVKHNLYRTYSDFTHAVSSSIENEKDLVLKRRKKAHAAALAKEATKYRTHRGSGKRKGGASRLAAPGHPRVESLEAADAELRRASNTYLSDRNFAISLDKQVKAVPTSMLDKKRKAVGSKHYINSTHSSSGTHLATHGASSESHQSHNQVFDKGLQQDKTEVQEGALALLATEHSLAGARVKNLNNKRKHAETAIEVHGKKKLMVKGPDMDVEMRDIVRRHVGARVTVTRLLFAPLK